MNVLWKYVRRELLSRPGRATLTLLSIVIGVAAVVSVNVATTTTHHAYQEMYEAATGRAALEVVADGGGTYAQDVVERLEAVPGVKAAVPLFQQPSVLYRDPQRVRLLVMGIDPSRDANARDYYLKAGHFFDAGDGAVMEAGFAEGLGIGVGDEIKLLTRRGVRPITVVGLLEPRGAAGYNQGGVVLLSLETAQRLFGQRDAINLTSLVLEPGADEREVERRVAAMLPEGLLVRVPPARTQLSKQTFQDAEQGLSFAYQLSLALAAFIILNTFLMNVGERRRQLAILRAIGATRRQIMLMLVGEGLLMGVIGTALGCAAGVIGAWGLTAGMSKVFSSPIPAVRITPQPFLLAAVLGPSVALVAVLIPAWLATRITPLEGMRPTVDQGQKPVTFAFTAAAVVTFLVTGSALAAAVVGWIPVALVIPAGVIFTMAFVLLIPVALGPLTRLAAWALRPVLRFEAELARRQLLRRRARTTLTIGVLYVAVSCAIGLGTTIINNVDDVRDWYDHMVVGDFFIRAMSPETAASQIVSMPESLGAEIAAVPGVAHVETLRFANAEVEGTPVIAVLRKFAADDRLPLDLSEGDTAEVRAAIHRGEVVIGSNLARRLGRSIGQSITLKTPKGDVPLRVAGITKEYMVGGLVVHLEWSRGQALLDAKDVDIFMVTAAPGATAAVESRLRPLCREQGLLLHSFAEAHRRLDTILGGVVGSLWALLGLSAVVAGFGIANTLGMNVLEQTRELALLRVVAMTRRQARKTIFAQAAILGAIGIATGIAGGTIGAYTSNICAESVLGHGVDFSIQPWLLGLAAPVALLVVLLAAWLPGERAARLSLLTALSYE